MSILFESVARAGIRVPCAAEQFLRSVSFKLINESERIGEAVALTIDVVREGETATIGAAGELDLSVADQLRSAVSTEVAAGARQLTVDLTALTFMDSTGLRVLLEALDAMEKVQGSLVVKVDTGPVERIIRITGLDTVLDVHS